MNKCYTDGPDIFIRVLKAEGTCKYGLQQGREFLLETSLPPGICPLLLHTVIPYYLTLTNGGYFRWTKHRDKVRVQCPNANDYVDLEINRTEKGDKQYISCRVLRQKGECRFGYKEGDTFSLGPDNSLKFCLRAFDTMFPLYAALKLGWQEPDSSGIKSIKVSCPDHRNTVVFELFVK